MHFRLINGDGFKLDVIDGSGSNKTTLSRITDDYNGKTITTGSSSVLEFYFSSKRGFSVGANLEMIVVEDKGSYLPFYQSLQSVGCRCCQSVSQSVTQSTSQSVSQ